MNKNNIKRTVASLLASLMLFSSSAVGYAGDFSDVKGEDQSIVDKVVASGIMIGTDLGFEPTKELTRAESMAIMVRLKGISEETVKASVGATNFSDVPADHWATGYINVATSTGLAEGIGDGKFAPDQKISYAETVTMLVRSLGAGPLVELEGTWPKNYVNFAMEENLTEGVYKPTMGITNRIETAKMATNTMEKPMWVKSGGSTGGEIEYSKDENKTILKTVLNFEVIENKILDDVKMSDKEVTIDGKDYDFGKNLSIRVEEGMAVDAWINKDKEAVFIAKSDSSKQEVIEFDEVISVSVTDDGTANDKIKLEINGSTKEYSLIDGASLSEDTQVSINGVSGKTLANLASALDSDAKCENTTGKIILNDGKIEKIFLTQYDEVMVVEKVKEEKIYNDDDVTSHADLDLEDTDYIIINEDGKTLNIDDLDEGDTLLVAKDSDTVRILALDNTVEGKVTEKSSNGSYVKIDGKKYEVNALINPTLPSVKDEVKLYLDNKGNIVISEELDSEVDSNIGVITEAAGIINTRGEVSAEVEITLLDGTKMPVKELDIDEMEKESKFNSENLFNETSTTTINEQLYSGGEASDLIGQMVRFKENSGKIEIVEFESGYKAYDGTDLKDLEKYSTDGKTELKLLEGYDMKIEEGKILKSGSATYRVSKDTKVIIEKSADKDYETKVEMINWEDLKDNSGIDMTVAEIDENTNTVKYVYIKADQSLSRETSDNYGMITNVAETSNDGEYRITVLSNQGEKELLVDNGTNFDSSYIGKVVSYSETDDKIAGIEVRDPKEATLKEAKIARFNDGTIKLSFKTNGTATEVVDSMEEVLFITADSITAATGETLFKFKGLALGDQGDIDLMGSDEAFDTTDVASVYVITLDTDGDGTFDNEIGIVLYEKE